MPLAYGLAGALSGFGTGIVEEARNKREERLLWMKREWQLADRDDDRAFQLQRDEISHSRQIERDNLAHTRQSERDEATRNFAREGRGTIVTGQDGSQYRIDGDTATQITGPDGEPFRGARAGDSQSPAEVRTAEWLIEQGVATDASDAWNKVRRARENPNSRASLVTQVYRSMLSDVMDRRSDEEKQQSAQDFVDRLLRVEDGEEETAPQSRGTRALPPLREDTELGAQIGGMVQPRAVERPEGATDEAIIEDAKAAIRRGAPREQVRERLRRLGIDPSKAGI